MAHNIPFNTPDFRSFYASFLGEKLDELQGEMDRESTTEHPRYGSVMGAWIFRHFPGTTGSYSPRAIMRGCRAVWIDAKDVRICEDREEVFAVPRTDNVSSYIGLILWWLGLVDYDENYTGIEAQAAETMENE